MAITAAQLHTHLEAARTALGSGNYAAAKTAALQALTVLAGLPDSEFAESRTHWRTTIDKLLEEIRLETASDAATAAGGLQFMKATYANPST